MYLLLAEGMVREPALKAIETSRSLSVYVEYASVGQAQHLAKVHRRIYSEKFTGEEKDAKLVLRLCWKALPSSAPLKEDDFPSVL